MQPYVPPAHHPHAPQPAAYSAAPDPFRKVRSLGASVVVLLALRAGMRALTYGTFKLFAPASGSLDPAAFDRLRTIDTALLGVENLLGVVAMIVFLVWIHAVFVALRNTGMHTRTSPGMAVGGWFIPLANLVLPALSVREALVGVRRPGALAVGWWLVWLVNIPLLGMHQLARQIMLVPELAQALPPEVINSMFETLQSSFWPFMIVDTLAWGLLAVIVATVRRATQPTV